MQIERKILIGMIVSGDFLKEIRPMYQSKIFKSSVAKRIASWCVSYFDQYNDAPKMNLELLYLSKVKEDKVPKEIAEEIEEDILPQLSEEFINEGFNLEHLLDQAQKYIRRRLLEEHTQMVQGLVEQGELTEAEKMIAEFSPKTSVGRNDIDLSSEEVLPKIEKAFTTEAEPLITFPGALGEFLNEQLVRGGFVAFMSPEKRGKSYWLMELAMRAAKQGKKVAFFQAGDMTEGQQLRRICIYRAKKSDKSIYCGKLLVPQKDCIYNQFDECDKEIRECGFGIFNLSEGLRMEDLRKKVTIEQLVKKLKEHPDYSPCYNCEEYKTRPWGTVWLKEVNTGNALTVKEAKEVIQQFFIEKKRKFKIDTYANDSLSILEIKNMLTLWDKQDGFVPDVLVVDYADLMTDKTHEFRHAQNNIWKGLRGLSQSQKCLVLTVTQSDAASYEKDRLSLKNFSEDKRKYAHVTAMYGLNQDTTGREKRLGIMRINELTVREGEFYVDREVHVLQRLQMGQPFLTSFW